MSRNGSGTYQLPAGNPVVSGTTISSTVHNATNADIATALTGSIAKDGQTTPTANLPMGSFRHTGVGNPIARNQYGTVDQIQDGEYTAVGSVAGTNTITGSLSPSISAYVAGMQVVLIPANSNTGATTLNLNSVGALDVQKYTSAGEVALGANDLRAGIPAMLLLDTGGDDWILLNPYSGALGDVTVGTITATTVSTTGLTTTNINGVTAPAAANPTGTIGLTAVNGVATTYPRSDSAPALSQAIAPTWTQPHIFSQSSSGTTYSLRASANVPGILITQTNGSADNKNWNIFASSEQLNFRALNDAGTVDTPWMQIDRTGTTVDTIALTSTALTWNGSAMVNLGSAPTWSGVHTFTKAATSGADTAIYLSSSLPRVSWNETDGTSDNKLWTATANSEQFFMAIENDAHSVATNWITVDRTGTTVDRVQFPTNSGGSFVIGSTVPGILNSSRLVIAGASGASAVQLENNSGSSTSPHTLCINNTATSGDSGFIRFATDNSGLGTERGSIDYNRGGGAVRYNTTSDAKLKNNFAPAGSAIELAMLIPVESFDWIESGHHVEFGYVAQRLNEHFPDAVSKGDVWQVDRSSLIPVLHRALQEVNADLQRHKAKVARALAALLED